MKFGFQIMILKTYNKKNKYRTVLETKENDFSLFFFLFADYNISVKKKLITQKKNFNKL